jgi:predicted nucleotide-binding protein
MDNLKTTIEELIAEGQKFTYDNFASKSDDGYPQAYSPGWIVWTHGVGEVRELLGNTPVGQSLHRGLNGMILGNEPYEFTRAHESIMSGLRASLLLPLPTPANSSPSAATKSNRVFIVHGHDHASKNELELFLKELGLDPIVLHRQPDEGQTVIEKFEKYSDVGYAFVLLTPDDIGYPAADDLLADEMRSKAKRARQNVVLEFGYFIGRLSRANVCCLYMGGVELPSDIHGLLYKEFHKSVQEVFYTIRKELEARKYKLK